jgi:hypothetical protein
MSYGAAPAFRQNYIYGLDAQSIPAPLVNKSLANSRDGEDLIAKYGFIHGSYFFHFVILLIA